MVFNKSNKCIIPLTKIDKYLIELTNYVDYLRVLINNCMTLNKHINYVSNNLKIVSFLIYKASIILDKESLKI